MRTILTEQEALTVSGECQCMLALCLDEELAEMLAIPGGEEAEELHLTIAYLGRPESIDGFADLQKKLLDYTLQQEPITVSLVGVGRFPASESSDERDVIYIECQSDRLVELREGLLSIVAEHGLQNASEHEFKPHITLAYIPPDAQLGVELDPMDVVFPDVSLVLGDRYYHFAFNEEDSGIVQPEAEEDGLPGTKLSLKEEAIDSLHSAVVPMPVDQSLHMGAPTDAQLEKMNRYRPIGCSPYTKDEVVTIPVVASHNLMSLSGMAWHINSLRKMYELMPNRPFELDHEWEQASKAVAFIYDAELIVTPDAPMEVLNQAGNYSTNREIVNRWGYVRLVLHLCAQKGTPIESGFRFRRLGDVSTGTLTYPTYICPLCELEFDDDRCPHLPPTPMVLWLAANDELTEEEKAAIAPYILRDGVFYAIETSAVIVGNLPCAGVVRNG